jgi:hypothetical protein
MYLWKALKMRISQTENIVNMQLRFEIFTLLVFAFCVIGCAPKHEAVMPYRNLGYTANRLMPVRYSASDFEFRIWINNSTSIDRVISVSKVNDVVEKGESYKGDEKSELVEIGELFKKRKAIPFYKETNKMPKSGVDSFIAKIDSLELFDVKGVPDSVLTLLATDTPFSLYVVELKEHGKYHCFKFYTSYPYKKDESGKYGEIQALMFKEFGYNFYFKKKKS